MKISPAKINALLWIEKAAILPVVLAASKGFLGECGASTIGDTCECSSIKKKKKKTQCCTLNIFHSFIIYHLNRRNKCRSVC